MAQNAERGTQNAMLSEGKEWHQKSNLLEVMCLKVGYPQALLYYKYFPLWEKFFSQLGAEVVLSPPTNKKILNKGTLYADNELCLPVKVFYGHILDLKDKVDAIFVPRIVSVEKQAFTCPKFLGLPDMARAIEEKLPPIISPTIDFRQNWRKYLRTIYELGKNFTSSRIKIFSAYRKGVLALHRFHQQLLEGKTPLEMLGEKARLSSPEGVGNGGQAAERPASTESSLTIGLAGHPYNIYDRYTSMNLIKRLRKMGAQVKTAEMLPAKIIEEEANQLPKKLFWTYEREVVGAVFSWAHSRTVDGIIYVLSFACGPDSLIQVLLEHELKKEVDSVPMMPLVIDEHSAEAGLVTRVEAFIDMLHRKKAMG